MALAAVGEQLRRLVERQPTNLVDLVGGPRRQVAEAPACVAQEEEADDLEDPLPGPGVRVADVTELLDEPPVRAGLLVHLAQSSLARIFAGRDVPLRQRPQAWFLACRTDRRQDPSAFQSPDKHAAR